MDLQTYRRQVTDFEREYDEIDCWFRQAKDGTYPIRTQAQKIAEQGRTRRRGPHTCHRTYRVPQKP